MKTDDENNLPELDDAGSARREFLDNAGKLAAYTPPLMLGLLMPGAHAIASGQTNGGNHNPDPSNYPSGDDDSGSSGDDDSGSSDDDDSSKGDDDSGD